MARKEKMVIKQKMQEAEQIMNIKQRNKCHAIIHSAAATSAAIGATPIPVADALPISATQITMVLALAKVFGQKVTEAAAKGLISSAAATFIGRNLVKLIPVAGMVISATVASSVTEAIGWTIAVEFAKKAKQSWEAAHNNAYGTQEYQAEETETERTEINNIIKMLQDRSLPFLEKQKNATDNKEEYEKLISDFEKVIDYIDKELKEVYIKLINLAL